MVDLSSPQNYLLADCFSGGFLLPFGQVTSTSALRFPARRLASKLAAVLLLLTTVLSGADVHGHALAALRAGAAAGAFLEPPDRCVTGAIAHDETHLESCGEPERPASPGCLHHLSVRTLHLPHTTSLQADLEGIRLPVVAAERHPSDPCFSWVGGRSPPLA